MSLRVHCPAFRLSLIHVCGRSRDCGYPKPDIPLDLDQSLQFHVLISIFLVLTHTTIFAIKFSYLFFFKCLIRQVRKLKIYWWTVTLITGAVCGLRFVDAFLSCHFFDMTRNGKFVIFDPIAFG